jgi:hypothetical protein
LKYFCNQKWLPKWIDTATKLMQEEFDSYYKGKFSVKVANEEVLEESGGAAEPKVHELSD